MNAAAQVVGFIPTQKFVAFKAAQPAAAKWLEENASNDFARSLRGSIERYGSLTERQLAAIARNLLSRVNVAGSGFSRMMEGFERASTQLKWPKLTIGEFVFSLVRRGPNEGGVYVKLHGEYLGKITKEGEWRPGFNCEPANSERVITIGKDPVAALVTHGKLTGNCGICSRPLTDPESVARGIGPVCMERYGWSAS